jgi:ribosomal-protein-alanine N-acetyltransferase
MTHEIQPLSLLAVDSMMKIEVKAHQYPWSRGMMQSNFGRFYSCRGLYINDELVGYFIVRVIVGEAELLNLCITPEFHGCGYGIALMQELELLLGELCAEVAMLEVRVSNQVAQRLYRKFGFEVIDSRTDYYPTEYGREDALIMQRYLAIESS